MVATSNKKVQSQRSRFSRLFQSLDMFGQNISFREGANDGFTTKFGAFMSLIITILVIVYGQKKFSAMLDHEDGSHQTYVEREIGRSEEINVAELGFNYGIFHPHFVSGKNFGGDFEHPFQEMFTLKAKVIEWTNYVGVDSDKVIA